MKKDLFIIDLEISEIVGEKLTNEEIYELYLENLSPDKIELAQKNYINSL